MSCLCRELKAETVARNTWEHYTEGFLGIPSIARSSERQD